MINVAIENSGTPTVTLERDGEAVLVNLFGGAIEVEVEKARLDRNFSDLQIRVRWHKNSDYNDPPPVEVSEEETDRVIKIRLH